MAQMYPPKKNTAFDLYFGIRDADGDLVTGATGLDSEVSVDGAAFADATNEATEIGSTGIYKLSLTTGEMNGDVIIVQTKTTSSGAKTFVVVIYTTESTWDEGVDAKAVLSGAITTASFAAGAINAAAIATDAIGAAELAADAVTEIQSGLATAAALATVDDFLDTEIAAIITALTTIDDFLDTEIAAILADTDDIQTRLPAALVGGRMDSSVGAMAAGVVTAAAVAADAIGASELAADAANEIADAILDRANGVETSYTPRQALRLILAACAAKLSGAATTTVVIRDVGDAKDRITATVDASGNRTAITLDAT